MSQTNNRETEGTEDEIDTENAPIGVYYVASDELVNDPENRTYHQRILWTDSGWTPMSNGEMVERAPDERTLDAFIEEFGGRNYFITPPDEVPGTIVDDDPRFSIADLDLDVPVADE